jgi:hypothetical protein
MGAHAFGEVGNDRIHVAANDCVGVLLDVVSGLLVIHIVLLPKSGGVHAPRLGCLLGVIIVRLGEPQRRWDQDGTDVPAAFQLGRLEPERGCGARQVHEDSRLMPGGCVDLEGRVAQVHLARGPQESRESRGVHELAWREVDHEPPHPVVQEAVDALEQAFGSGDVEVAADS